MNELMELFYRRLRQHQLTRTYSRTGIHPTSIFTKKIVFFGTGREPQTGKASVTIQLTFKKVCKLYGTLHVNIHLWEGSTGDSGRL